MQQLELLEQSDHAVRNLSRQLTYSLDENRQYRHISSHTLQEPLRKLRVFSGMLVDAIRLKEMEKARHLALRINSGAERFSHLIKDLSNFTSLEDNTVSQLADLEYIIGVTIAELRPKLEAKQAKVHIGEFPTLTGVPSQLEQLFGHLVENAITFSKKDIPLVLSISSQEYTNLEGDEQLSTEKQYTQIQVTDNGIGIDPSQLEKIFDMFSQLPSDEINEGAGIGLSICRKIIRNNGGHITISSQAGSGTTVSVILPLDSV